MSVTEPETPTALVVAATAAASMSLSAIERGASLADGPELMVRDLLPSSQKTPPLPLPGGNAEQFVEQGLPFKEAKQRVLTHAARNLSVALSSARRPAPLRAALRPLAAPAWAAMLRAVP